MGSTSGAAVSLPGAGEAAAAVYLPSSLGSDELEGVAAGLLLKAGLHIVSTDYERAFPAVTRDRWHWLFRCALRGGGGG